MGAPKEDSSLLPREVVRRQDSGRELDHEIEAALRKADAAAAAAPSAAPGPGKNLLIFFCVTAFIFNQINFSQLPAFLPDYAERVKGVTPAWVGLILGVQGAAGLVACAVAPSIVRCVANVPALVAAQTALAVTTFVLGLTTDELGRNEFIASCMALRALQGFADGIVQVAAMSLILRVVPEQTTGMYVGLTEGLRSIGTLLGPVIGGYTYSHNAHVVSGNWRLPFLLSGAFVALHAVAFLLLAGSVESTRVTQRATRQSMLTVFCIPQASLVILVCAACIFTLGFYEPTLLPYLTSPPFRLNTGQTGLLMTGTSLVMGISAAIAGPAQHICGQMVQMVVGMVMAAGSMALFGFISPYQFPQFTVVAYVLSCASVMVVFVSATEMLVRVLHTFSIDPNEHAEAISSGISASFILGLASGSLFGGAMQQALDFQGACRAIFFILISLPVITLVPFHPYFMKGNVLSQSTSQPKKGRKADVEGGDDD